MGRRKQQRDKSGMRGKVLERVEITGIAAEGKAIARVNDKVVFVPFAAPGDVVDIRIKKSKASFLEGEIIKVHVHSTEREEPFCSHFGICGGCKWQHLPYEKQLEYKHQQVLDSLQRIGKVNLDVVKTLPIIASEKTMHYRNKLEYTFSNKRWLTSDEIDTGNPIKEMNGLGFHIPGYFDKVLDIKSCWLQQEPSNRLRLSVKAFAKEQNIPFYNLHSQTGLLRNLIIRNNPAGEFMVVVVFAKEEPYHVKSLLDHIAGEFPEVISLAYVINAKRNDSITDLEPVIYKGDPYLIEVMDGLRFRVGPKSFFQTNSLQALQLYRVALDFAGLEGHELVYDLYTGTGTIALFMARQAGRVIGIEYVEEAVAHARENAALNGLGNLKFFAGDMAAILDDIFFQKHGFPHVVITDPPRAGMHPKVITQLLASSAERIVYVSCNPATQARDVELLSNKYRVTKVQPVDMFPHTHHVESVVLLERKV
jgi:23S rRNA (uracil1939-C5)-methyltransferase